MFDEIKERVLKECFCLKNLVSMEYGFLHTLGLLTSNLELVENSINDIRRGSFGLANCHINCDKNWVRIFDVEILRSKSSETTCLGTVEGHPDKLCDQILDVVLDACLLHDPVSMVACETCTMTFMEIGFVYVDVGLDADKCKVLVNIEQQSPAGGHGLLIKNLEEIGAGDQGHTVKTPELIPLIVKYENDHGVMVFIHV
ncbi:hypothetical protein POM88_035480 [Heracleum sosnowskyi]|uniref:S-adenosylmethionine synthetase N-terminal domain-containing protein n=1 Tax=Heracleum sosnowskyi TaxID=360622 RepID=A0AAD8HN85_9APIA|nr:hypothetical protein POM88_035480 [Heracleum sosnowskyi]